MSSVGLIQFRHLVMGDVNRKYLTEISQVCRKTLSVKFKVFFDKSVSAIDTWRLLPPTLTASNDPWTLAIDGTWLHRNGVVMIYRDVTHHQSESYEALRRDLTVLVELLGGHQPSGVVSDWKGSIVNGVANYFDHLPHQRCLVHVESEAKRWLPKRTPFVFYPRIKKHCFVSD